MEIFRSLKLPQKNVCEPPSIETDRDGNIAKALLEKSLKR